MPEHTIAENLTRLQNAKTAIGNAITAKGGTVASGDGLEEFAADIATITNQYSAGDEGKVVSNGALIAQTAYPTTITENGTYNTTTNNSVVVNVSSNDAIYPMYVVSGDSHLINSYELYYTVPATNKIYIFGKINSRSSSGARFTFSKPLSECGITSNSALTVYYFSIDYGNYYASSAAAYVKQSSFTITKDTTYVKIEGPNNSQHNCIIISWYPY
jgi:hypothetical protein